MVKCPGKLVRGANIWRAGLTPGFIGNAISGKNLTAPRPITGSIGRLVENMKKRFDFPKTIE
jgi:hypothetical protein